MSVSYYLCLRLCLCTSTTYSHCRLVLHAARRDSPSVDGAVLRETALLRSHNTVRPSTSTPATTGRTHVPPHVVSVKLQPSAAIDASVSASLLVHRQPRAHLVCRLVYAVHVVRVRSCRPFDAHRSWLCGARGLDTYIQKMREEKRRENGVSYSKGRHQAQ